MSDRHTTGEATFAEDTGFYGSAQPFAAGDVDEEAIALMDRFLAEHPGGSDRLIPVLHLLQEHLGCLPFAVQERVAERMGLSPIEVFSVLSFYHFFTLTPRGRFPLKVCMGTACFVRHAAGLIDTIRNTLKIEMGGCTEDRVFSLEQVRCLGACGLAPAVMVGQDVHGNLDSKRIRRLLTQLRARARREAAATAREPSHG
jgi:NADH-quinone oxidoreductase subunit E/NADP-reducing hydrogenase subunit HndA